MVLKIFIWPEFCPDYTSGLAFAIAETEQEARKMVIKKSLLDYLGEESSKNEWGKLEIKPLTEKLVYYITGSD